MRVERLEPFAEVLLITPRVFGDERGFFKEHYKRSAYAELGLPDFVQDNHSRSVRGTVRGLHYQAPPRPQGKLVSVIRGRVLDVAVDLRRGSPTFGRWAAAELSDEDHRQLWVPAGFAHGFAVLSESADLFYKVTAEYAPELDRGVRWDDPEIGVDWGVEAPLLSDRDRRTPLLRDAELPTDGAFAYQPEEEESP